MTTTLATPKPAARWIKPLLLASLMLNIMVAGAIAGRTYVNRQAGGGPGGGQGAFVLLQFARTLPQEQARAVRQIAKAERPRLRLLRQEAQALRADYVKSLAADPFDSVQSRAVAQRVAAAEQTVRLTQLEAVSKVAEILTPAQRAAFTELIRARQRAWQKSIDVPATAGEAKDE